MERAIVVGCQPLDELIDLISSAGALVVHSVLRRRDAPDTATYIGKGKVEELREAVLEYRADLVVFDDELTFSQARNLEEAVEAKVIDRTRLILDVFARRARTREGRLQVELAQLSYNLTHLAGSAGHLSRLGGGIGTRGPGETKLETDRRRIRHRIAVLKQDIERIRKHRKLHRKHRRREGLPLVALVGYTNAGKSTLFRALSEEDTLVSSRLFSTLDTLIRRIRGGGRELPILVSDTVGFIRKLPHQLVSAFRATFEEVAEADLILHVIDVSAPDRIERQRVVTETLQEIGAAGHPQFIVYNKADLLDQTGAHGAFPVLRPNEFLISAAGKQGIEELTAAIAHHFRSGHVEKNEYKEGVR